MHLVSLHTANKNSKFILKLFKLSDGLIECMQVLCDKIDFDAYKYNYESCIETKNYFEFMELFPYLINSGIKKIQIDRSNDQVLYHNTNYLTSLEHILQCHISLLNYICIIKKYQFNLYVDCNFEHLYNEYITICKYINADPLWTLNKIYPWFDIELELKRTWSKLYNVESD